MGRPIIDLTGRIYGCLTVVKLVPQPEWDTGHCVKWWLCRCTCGTEKAIRGNHLKRGAKSCGCQQREAVRRATVKHGRYKTREYRIWSSMVQRCSNPNAVLFHRYGAKGLIVDPSWRTFQQFFADMGPCPTNYSLDRIDNAKGYAPGNCRWADIFEQNRNRSMSNWIEWNGERLTVSEWARKLRITRNTVKNRWQKHHNLYPVQPRWWPRKTQPPTLTPNS